MKKLNLSIYTLCGALLLSGCGMNNTGKGSLIGAGTGTGVGALVGGLIGKGKGAGIGAAVGAAVGAGAGALIGRRMDKAKAAAEAVENAQVETVTDNNGLQAVKVTFDSGILFATGDATLSTSAKASLSKFATSVLNQNTDMDVAIKGYTDNQGWKTRQPPRANKKPRPVASAGTKRAELPAELRRAGCADYVGRGLGRSQPRRIERHQGRPAAEPPR